MTQPEQPDLVPRAAAGPSGSPRRTIPGLLPPRIDAAAMEARGRAFGREVEEAALRVSRDPFISGMADVAARAWGLIVLAFGVWFLMDVTLGYSLPAIPWREAWPLGLVLVGLLVVIRGTSRRRA
jgi:hypothetical protein